MVLFPWEYLKVGLHFVNKIQLNFETLTILTGKNYVNSVQEFIEIEVWLLLTFFLIYTWNYNTNFFKKNQLNSI